MSSPPLNICILICTETKNITLNGSLHYMILLSQRYIGTPAAHLRFKASLFSYNYDYLGFLLVFQYFNDKLYNI